TLASSLHATMPEPSESEGHGNVAFFFCAHNSCDLETFGGSENKQQAKTRRRIQHKSVAGRSSANEGAIRNPGTGRLLRRRFGCDILGGDPRKAHFDDLGYVLLFGHLGRLGATLSDDMELLGFLRRGRIGTRFFSSRHCVTLTDSAPIAPKKMGHSKQQALDPAN